MPIHIDESPEPLSDASLRSVQDAVRIATSDAGRVLKGELERYCRGEITGRSFLVAGHRGSGKTTMVADAIDKVLRASRSSRSDLLRPLPIFLHGPSLFAGEFAQAGEAVPRDDAVAADGAQETGAGAALAAAAPDRAAAPDDDGASPPHEVARTSAGGARSAQEMAAQARAALTQITLGLHRAVAREFARAYRLHVVDGEAARKRRPRDRREFAELAAQFEVELGSGAGAARLREFWELADAIGPGILFTTAADAGMASSRAQRQDQGALELAALHGVCDAHRRISGAIDAKERVLRSDERTSESSRGLALKGGELVSPLVSVLSGVAVYSGAASHAQGTVASLLAGGVAALGSSLMFQSSSRRSTRSMRESEQTFIPDLSLGTLDRVLPVLIQRLRDAGLAPVLVIDELDKVEGLSARLVAMIQYLKKFVAETVFTCFLTDRGYLEHLSFAGGAEAYGRASSYFSHPLLVAFRPSDFDAYLDGLLKVGQPRSHDAGEQGGFPAAPRTETSVTDEVDLEVLKWALRYRSELHALTLAREISALRGDGRVVQLSPGVVRTDMAWRIAVTFQVAVELHLAHGHVAAWLRQRPDRMQRVVDAAYYLAREWQSGRPRPDLQREGAFLDYLTARMNLEVAPVPQRAFSDDDRKILNGIAQDMAAFLSQSSDEASVRQSWADLPPRDWGTFVSPSLAVVQAMLLGEQSLLVRGVEDGRTVYEWRYRPSGALRDAPDFGGAAPSGPASAAVAPAPAATTSQLQEAWRIEAEAAMELIGAVEASLAPFIDGTGSSGHVFELLADRLRVLPTTPAWQPVRAAMANLGLMLKGAGRPSTIEADLQSVSAYLDMLQSQAAAVLLTLEAAAWCAGMATPENVDAHNASSIRRVAEMMSGALDFSQRDGAGVVSVLRHLRLPADLAPFELTEVDALPMLDDGAGVAALVDASLARGRALRAASSSYSLIDVAWSDLRDRLDRELAANAEARPERVGPSLIEIVCACSGLGPGRLLALDLSKTTMHAWTTALLLANSLVKSRIAESQKVPPWMTGYALNRLGAATLARPMLVALIRSLQSGADDATRDGVALQAQVATPGFTPRNWNRIAVCVTCGPGSVFDDWVGKPSTGMALVVTAQQFETLAGAGVLRVLEGAKLLVAVADPFKQPVTLDRALAKVKAPVVYAYPFRQADMRQPRVVNPSRLHDLFDATDLGGRDAPA